MTMLVISDQLDGSIFYLSYNKPIDKPTTYSYKPYNRE